MATARPWLGLGSGLGLGLGLGLELGLGLKLGLGLGLDFLQWQPLLCRPTASLFAAPPGAEWLILGRKAEGLRSSVCQWCAEPSGRGVATEARVPA